MPAPFSDTVMEHFFNPRNVGRLPSPPAVEGTAGSPDRGPYLRISLRFQDGHLVEARFQSYGCVPAIAAGSLLTELAQGRSRAELQALTPQELERGLGGLPDDRRFCAELAVEALRNALAHAGTTP